MNCAVQPVLSVFPIASYDSFDNHLLFMLLCSCSVLWYVLLAVLVGLQELNKLYL